MTQDIQEANQKNIRFIDRIQNMQHRIAQNLVPDSRFSFDKNFTILLETENSFLCVKFIELLLGFSEYKKGLQPL